MVNQCKDATSARLEEQGSLSLKKTIYPALNTRNYEWVPFLLDYIFDKSKSTGFVGRLRKNFGPRIRPCYLAELERELSRIIMSVAISVSDEFHVDVAEERLVWCALYQEQDLRRATPDLHWAVRRNPAILSHAWPSANVLCRPVNTRTPWLCLYCTNY